MAYSKRRLLVKADYSVKLCSQLLHTNLMLNVTKCSPWRDGLSLHRLLHRPEGNCGKVTNLSLPCWFLSLWSGDNDILRELNTVLCSNTSPLNSNSILSELVYMMDGSHMHYLSCSQCVLRLAESLVKGKYRTPMSL